jgi:hypothetical protein
MGQCRGRHAAPYGGTHVPGLRDQEPDPDEHIIASKGFWAEVPSPAAEGRHHRAQKVLNCHVNLAENRA